MIPVKKLSFITIMTSLCISTNYLLMGIPNVKFMDLFVFVSGYTMGSLSGALVGVLTWLVYGTLNPYGFNLPTLIATCIGESFYGVFGGLTAKSPLKISLEEPQIDNRILPLKEGLKLGILGFLITFMYDLFTNVVTAIVFEIPLFAYIIMGMSFTVTHEISNFFFFFLAGRLLIKALKKMNLSEVINH